MRTVLPMGGACTIQVASNALILAQQGLAERPDLPAAHAVALARHLEWPILTADLKRWEAVRASLPWHIRLVEIAELDQ